MHFSALLVTLGAAVASAHTGHAINAILKRDIPGLPSGCSSRCATINSIYDACLNDDFNTCETICDPDVQPKYKDCLQCIVDNAPSSVQSQLSGAISQVDSLCNSGLSDSGTGSSSSGSGDDGLGSPSASSPGGGLGSPATSQPATPTGPFSGDEPSQSSASGSGTGTGTGNTGNGNSGTGNSNSQPSGGSANGNSNSQPSSAATTSGGAGVAAKLPNMVGGVVALLGAGAGAALLF